MSALIIRSEQSDRLLESLTLLSNTDDFSQVSVETLLDDEVLLHVVELLFVHDRGGKQDWDVLYLLGLDEQSEGELARQREEGTLGVLQLFEREGVVEGSDGGEPVNAFADNLADPVGEPDPPVLEYEVLQLCEAVPVVVVSVYFLEEDLEEIHVILDLLRLPDLYLLDHHLRCRPLLDGQHLDQLLLVQLLHQLLYLVVSQQVLHHPAPSQMREPFAVLLAFLAQVVEDVSYMSLLQVLHYILLARALHLLTLFPRQNPALCAETLLNAVPVYDRTVKCQYVHALVYAGVLQIRGLQKLLDGLKCYFERVIHKLRSFLGYPEIEYLALFVSLDNVVTGVKLVFNQGRCVFGPQRVRLGLLGLLGTGGSDHISPLEYRVPLCLVSIDEYEDAALSTAHVLTEVLKVLLILVFVEQIPDLLPPQLSLQHVLDLELF